MMQSSCPRSIAHVERTVGAHTPQLLLVGMCITHLESGDVVWHSSQVICYTLLTSIHELVQVQKCQPRREGKQWPDVPFIEAILKRMLHFSEFAIIRMYAVI